MDIVEMTINEWTTWFGLRDAGRNATAKVQVLCDMPVHVIQVDASAFIQPSGAGSEDNSCGSRSDCNTTAHSERVPKVDDQCMAAVGEGTADGVSLPADFDGMCWE